MKFDRLAIDCYNEAEQIVDTTDFMTVGLLNFRIGELYQNSFISNSEPIDRYKRAIKYFKRAHHEAFENYTYGYLGQMYITKDYDSAYHYITRTIEWAEAQEGEGALLDACRIDLSKLYWCHETNINARKELLLGVYRDRDSANVDSDLYFHLTDVYCKLGQIDSAKYFAAQCPELIRIVDTMHYYMMSESLATATGDYKTAYESYRQGDKIADTIIVRGKAEQYYATDKQFDYSAAYARVEKLSRERTTHLYVITIISLASALIFFASYIVWRRKKLALLRQRLLIEQLQDDIELQQRSSQGVLDRNMRIIGNLNKTIEEKGEIERSLKNIVAQRMKVMQELLSLNYVHGGHPDRFLQQFNEVIIVNKKSAADCDSIIHIANQLHNNVVDRIADNHPEVSYNDKLLLSLVCMEFSAVEIKVFLDLPTPDAVYMAKSRLKKKLGVLSLESCFESIKNS